jgi:pimeloyl-ACP methyl ester carboxylesterase
MNLTRFRSLATLLLCALWNPVAHADTFVLVHGAWGGGWTYKALDHELTQQGHTVYRPTLTGLGERVHLASSDITLDTHIQDVVNLMLYEDLHDITLVGHSYGGMVITGVADRVPERIARMIYLDAVVPGDGESLLDIHRKRAGMLEKLTRDGFVMFPRDTRNDPPPKNVPQPLKTVTEPLHLRHQRPPAIDTTYILTVAQGQKAEDDDFAAQAERARARGWKVIQMTGDHNIQRTAPEALAALLAATPDETAE